MVSFLFLAAVAAAAPGGKTMAMDDWQTLAITGVTGESGGPLYLRVQAGDLDGDGKPDEAAVELVCTAGKVTDASYVITAREAGSGMATGRRQFAPVKITKEWSAASPQLQKIRPQYDIKTLKGNERMADGWTRISLTNTDGLCGAAEAASIVKSKSNITNN
jgi:hypothetical protein